MLNIVADILTPRRLLLATLGLFLLASGLMLTPLRAQDAAAEEIVYIGDGDTGDGALAAAGGQAPAYSASDLDELVGPVALYPDDLLAIVLPAATYPVQLVQAARFLEALEQDPALRPDEDWDDAVVALLNYPEVIQLLNDDLDWTWRLGEAVLNQQEEVFDAIGRFRERAYAAGNLKSDDRQEVVVEEQAIEIRPADPEVIYVPYYEPERVVVYQPMPVYYYYSYPRPVYYYPYPLGYSFSSGFFWGVTTAFVLGWDTGHIHVHHSYYPSHPYYRHHYHGSYYVRHHTVASHDGYHDYPRAETRHYGGDRWQPRRGAGGRPIYRDRDRQQLSVARGNDSRDVQRYRPRAIDRQVAEARQAAHLSRAGARDAEGQRDASRRRSGNTGVGTADGDRDAARGGGRNAATGSAVRDRNGRSNYNPASWRPAVKQYTASPRRAPAQASAGERQSRERVLASTRPARPVTASPALASREPVNQAASSRAGARQLRRDDGALQSRTPTRRETPIQSRGSASGRDAGDVRRPPQARQSSPARSVAAAPRDTRQAAPARVRSERQTERKSAPVKSEARESSGKERGSKKRERRK